jgi:hypothetical protein
MDFEDFAVSYEKMMIGDGEEYGVSYGTKYGGAINAKTSISETGTVDAFMRMDTPTGSMSIDEKNISVENMRAKVPAATEMLELAIAQEELYTQVGGAFGDEYGDEYGGEYGTPFVKLEEKALGKIINEAAEMDIDSDMNLYHAIELYHTISGDTDVQVKYPRYNVRYEEYDD